MSNVKIIIIVGISIVVVVTVAWSIDLPSHRISKARAASSNMQELIASVGSKASDQIRQNGVIDIYELQKIAASECRKKRNPFKLLGGSISTGIKFYRKGEYPVIMGMLGGQWERVKPDASLEAKHSAVETAQSSGAGNIAISIIIDPDTGNTYIGSAVSFVPRSQYISGNIYGKPYPIMNSCVVAIDRWGIHSP